MLSIFERTMQELYGAEVPGAAVNQHRLRPSQRVGAELGRIEPDVGDPFMNQTRVLPCREPARGVASNGK